jgi:hypothetical protein
MRTISYVLRHLRGQSLVEFALIVPLLILFILGIVEVGYALFIYTQVENAAREGARAAAVRPCPSSADTTAIVSATRDRLPALVDVNTINPSITYPGGGQNYGDEVRIAINYQFQLLDPLTTVFIPQVNVNAVASRTITTGCGGAGGGGGSPTNTPTVGPSATPTTLGMCTVPNLVNGRANAAAGTWSAAGFSGTVIKNGSGNFIVASQSLAYGSSQPCTSGVTIGDIAPTNTPLASATPTQTAPPTPTVATTNTPTPIPLTVSIVGFNKPNGNNKPISLKVLVTQNGVPVIGASASATIGSTTFSLNNTGSGYYSVCNYGSFDGNGITASITASYNSATGSASATSSTTSFACP